MNYQDDMQQILNLLNDYTQKHNIDNKKVKDAYNAIYALIPNTNTQATTTTTTNTSNKKAEPKTQKTDIYDTWNNLIRSRMTQL